MYPPGYDFILDNPYETDEDRIESLKLIAEIPKPFHLHPFSLILYPGTQLYEMAKRDNLIWDEKKQIYETSFTNREPTYLNLLLLFAKNGNFPSPVLKIMVNPPVVDIFNSNFMKPVMKCFYTVLRGSVRTMRKILTGRK
jgi:radical SAM superfamily enzyme YgiQ (UPF0313 family)